MAFIDALPHEMTSSMLNEVQNGRRLELPWLGARVVEMVAKRNSDANERNPRVAPQPHVDGHR